MKERPQTQTIVVQGRELETTNSDLAAALCAVGIPLRRREPTLIVTGHGGDRYAFFFAEQSPCRQYRTQELMKAWDDDEWHRRNPEHPFAYLRVAFRNRQRLMDHMKKKVPMVLIEKNGKLAFLSLHATDALQKKIFAELRA